MGGVALMELFYFTSCLDHIAAPALSNSFWNPRLGANLIPKVLGYRNANAGNENGNETEEIDNKNKVLIEGYNTVLALVMLIDTYTDQVNFPEHNFFAARYYNILYRVALKHLHALLEWVHGSGGKYYDTHKLWRKKYFYIHKFVPDWMKRYLPWVTKEEWDYEVKLLRDYENYVKHKQIFIAYHPQNPWYQHDENETRFWPSPDVWRL